LNQGLIESSSSESASIRSIHTFHKLEFWFFYLHEHTLSDTFSLIDNHFFLTQVDICKLDSIIVTTIILIDDTDTIDLHETIVLKSTGTRSNYETISLWSSNHCTCIYEFPLTRSKCIILERLKVKGACARSLVFEGFSRLVFDTNLHKIISQKIPLDYMKKRGKCELFFDISHHILLPFSVPTHFFIVPIWRTRHLSKEELSNIHTRTEDDRYRVHIRQFKCDVEIVPRIDESCSIMHDESDTSQR